MVQERKYLRFASTDLDLQFCEVWDLGKIIKNSDPTVPFCKINPELSVRFGINNSRYTIPVLYRLKFYSELELPTFFSGLSQTLQNETVCFNNK
jgi:hypothetical protein